MDRLFGTPIRELREEANLSQHKLASIAGLTQPALSKIENGSCWPIKQNLGHIGKALGVSTMTYFFCLADNIRDMPPEFWKSFTWDDLIGEEGLEDEYDTNDRK